MAESKKRKLSASRSPSPDTRDKVRKQKVLYTSGTFGTQPIRESSPDRIQRVTQSLESEFPKKKKQQKLPLQNAVEGRAKELLLMDFLNNPRPGGKQYTTFDPNQTISKSFPAVDIFAVDQTGGGLLMLQSKSHQGSTTKSKVSAYQQDLNKMAQSAESLSKRIHNDQPKQYQSYKQDLQQQLSKMMQPKDQLPNFLQPVKPPPVNSSFKRLDQFEEEVAEKRDQATQSFQSEVLFPAPLEVTRSMKSDQMITQPFPSSDITKISSVIPYRQPSQNQMKEEDPDWK